MATEVVRRAPAPEPQEVLRAVLLEAARQAGLRALLEAVLRAVLQSSISAGLQALLEAVLEARSAHGSSFSDSRALGAGQVGVRFILR